MATAEQLKSLIWSYFVDDRDRSKTIVLQQRASDSARRYEGDDHDKKN